MPLVILSGPSGVGKDTVIDAWHDRDPRVTRVVAYTTRTPRAGERDGTDYHFVSVDQFLECAENGEFLEAKEVHGHHYATPLKDMEALLAEDKVAVLKIDVQGALTVMALRPDARSVFVLPPDVDELERRLRARGTDDDATVLRRLENARGELALAERYEHRLVNDDVDVVVARLVEIAS